MDSSTQQEFGLSTPDSRPCPPSITMAMRVGPPEILRPTAAPPPIPDVPVETGQGQSTFPGLPASRTILPSQPSSSHDNPPQSTHTIPIPADNPGEGQLESRPSASDDMYSEIWDIEKSSDLDGHDAGYNLPTRVLESNNSSTNGGGIGYPQSAFRDNNTGTNGAGGSNRSITFEGNQAYHNGEGFEITHPARIIEPNNIINGNLGQQRFQQNDYYTGNWNGNANIPMAMESQLMPSVSRSRSIRSVPLDRSTHPNHTQYDVRRLREFSPFVEENRAHPPFGPRPSTRSRLRENGDGGRLPPIVNKDCPTLVYSYSTPQFIHAELGAVFPGPTSMEARGNHRNMLLDCNRLLPAAYRQSELKPIGICVGELHSITHIGDRSPASLLYPGWQFKYSPHVHCFFDLLSLEPRISHPSLTGVPNSPSRTGNQEGNIQNVNSNMGLYSSFQILSSYLNDAAPQLQSAGTEVTRGNFNNYTPKEITWLIRFILISKASTPTMQVPEYSDHRWHSMTRGEPNGSFAGHNPEIGQPHWAENHFSPIMLLCVSSENFTDKERHFDRLKEFCKIFKVGFRAAPSLINPNRRPR